MRHVPSALMLFAAGFGTRMRHMTARQPKPLVPVGGRPLIDCALDLAREVDASPIVANLHYLPEMLEAHLQGSEVKTVREEPDILDTGGGLRNALPLLGRDPVFTLNSDAIWAGPNPLRLLLDAWDPEKMDALLICVPMAQVQGRDGAGDFAMDADGRLSRGGDTVYGGAQIIRTDLLHDVEDAAFSLNVVWDMIHTRQRLFGLRYPGQWCDVGHPEGIAQAEAMLAHSDV
ncbi:nucleotidyltransferase family protein [uncultured Tateyamaria sp.]|uniref:nucleotidyltransferase family protein n=1 Tax=uncultured Tateyamaria sp. TaxID=455651 RepID=UPI0026085E54|nr:nucleotidyltransferase family protein [uncultured Tateyamaria sp.]